MGGSGMGKTTLLKLIGGLLTPDKGEVFIDGERLNTANLDSLYRIRRKMGMLFQFGALFTDMTVFDNVAFPLREHTDLPEALIRVSFCSNSMRSDFAVPLSFTRPRSPAV